MFWRLAGWVEDAVVGHCFPWEGMISIWGIRAVAPEIQLNDCYDFHDSHDLCYSSTIDRARSDHAPAKNKNSYRLGLLARCIVDKWVGRGKPISILGIEHDRPCGVSGDVFVV